MSALNEKGYQKTNKNKITLKDIETSAISLEQMVISMAMMMKWATTELPEISYFQILPVTIVDIHILLKFQINSYNSTAQSIFNNIFNFTLNKSTVADLYLKNEMNKSPNGLPSLDYIKQRLSDSFENNQHHV